MHVMAAARCIDHFPSLPSCASSAQWACPQHGATTIPAASLLHPVRGRDTKPSRQPPDLLDAIGADWRRPLCLGFGRSIACRIPCLAALAAQGAQRLAQQGPFTVAQAAYGLWFRQGAPLPHSRP